MTAVVTLEGAPGRPWTLAEVAAGVARRLTGPVVVLPFDALRREWLAKPRGGDADAAVAAQQLKLLAAGYVKAGYHLVVQGLSEDGARDDLLRLMRMVPSVSALSVSVGGDGAGVDLPLAASGDAEALAQTVWEALPPEALGG